MPGGAVSSGINFGCGIDETNELNQVTDLSVKMIYGKLLPSYELNGIVPWAF